MRREKIRGTICFLGGILLVFLRWPFVGFGVEIFGFLNLFGDFFPVIFGFLRRLPIIGTILSHPAISRVIIIEVLLPSFVFDTHHLTTLNLHSLHHAKVEHAFNA
ncbi:hypothetical protein INT43_001872 [Umbelopsis isabellina]|uniref:Uncharacterized protein n=1 Tax=Mortierella isabellina TaxID=91625 RepID=A0A8H7PSF1_MORIS|nr:hypothetical protein INT43_001872 [Umbelopsis isabellina]